MGIDIDTTDTDLDVILAGLDERPTLARTINAVRHLDEFHHTHPGGFSSRSLVMVRNFTIEPIEPYLRLAGYRTGVHLGITYSEYSPAADENLDRILASSPDAVFILLRLEDLAPALARDFLATDPNETLTLAEQAVNHVVHLAQETQARSSAPVIVHNFVVPLSPAAGILDSQEPNGQVNLVRRINLRLVERIAQREGIYLLDFDHLLASVGLRHCAHERGDRQSGAPLSPVALAALAEAQVRHLNALKGPTVKCVVVDCDDTLWGGVIGEDGLSGIHLGDVGRGRRFRDFQHGLSNLRRRGIVLSICSKNEEVDVMEVLQAHPDCVLRPSDFVTHRINWNEKADNILSIAEELNVSIDHMVFIDDDAVQCGLAKSQLPALRVLQWPHAFNGIRSLDDLLLFDSLVSTNEDRSRTEMYQAERRRRAARADGDSPEQYIASLGLDVNVGDARAVDLSRIAQLSQRTNQFNLTTRRYDVSGLESLVSDSNVRVMWIEARDRFGDYGVVGCGIVRREQDEAVIDTFLLSCRVLGRQLERVVANRLAARARVLGAATLIGDYIPSGRNAQVADLYTRLDFEGPKENGGTKRWRWTLAKGDPTVPEWMKMSDSAETRE